MKFHYQMNPCKRVPKLGTRSLPYIFVFWDFFGKTVAPQVCRDDL